MPPQGMHPNSGRPHRRHYRQGRHGDDWEHDFLTSPVEEEDEEEEEGEVLEAAENSSAGGSVNLLSLLHIDRNHMQQGFWTSDRADVGSHGSRKAQPCATGPFWIS